MRITPSLCLLFLTTAASSADYTFTGFAHDLDTGALLYVETHAVSSAGSPGEQRVVLYRAGEGATPFARKHLRYGADRARPDFDFDDRRSGYAESATRDAQGFVVVARAGAQARAGRTQLRTDAIGVIDAGFDEFVRAHWSQLQRGDSLAAPFLVPSRLAAVNFRVRRVAGARLDDAEASVIRLSVSGPLGWFLPDIDVSYRDRDRRLLRYRGLTNIRDAAGELICAQIDFPDSGVVTGEVDLARLRALPLGR